MQTKCKRPIPGEGTGRAKQRYLFKQKHHNKLAGNFQRKTYPSRHQEQRQKDAVLLAAVGLGFEPVAGTTFHRFTRGV